MAKWRNRLLLGVIENEYGTAPAMTGADAIQVSEIDVTPLEVELRDRELVTGVFGNTEKVVGMQMSRASFAVEVAGSGEAGTPPKWGIYHRACGFDQDITVPVPPDPGPEVLGSVAYAPVSTGHESAACVFFADGIRHVLRGMRGTWRLAMEAGEIPKWSYEFTCLHTEEVAEANPLANFAAQAKPVAFNSGNSFPVSVHGFAACLENLSLDLNNEVIFRQLAGCSEQVLINDRKPAGSLQIDRPTLAQKNYFAALRDQTLDVISVQHGQTAGSSVTINMPSCNLGAVAYADSSGSMMLGMDYMPNPTGAGNNEISIIVA
jgi:hypothetical protein